MENEGGGFSREKKFEEEKVLEEMRDKIANLYGKDMFGFQKMVLKKAEDLKSKYPDAENYRLYHLMIGSSPWEECAKFDFPGEDSVEIFLDEAERKLSEEAA